MKLRLAAPSLLVDLQRLRGAPRDDRANGDCKIGAGMTHDAATGRPGLALAPPDADPLVRYLGTIGGSLANGDPASDLPAILPKARGR